MFFIKGLILGFCIAAPVGPIGLLCIKRTLRSGFLFGIAGGLGTAFADAFYAAIAAFGVTAISDFLTDWQTPIRIGGGIFLIFLAYRIFTAPPAHEKHAPSAQGAVGNFTSTFFLTLTNPATIILFTAVFAGLGLTEGSFGQELTLVTGVFCGSMLWWISLAGFIAKVRSHKLLEDTKWINHISGTILGAFGVLAIISIYW